MVLRDMPAGTLLLNVPRLAYQQVIPPVLYAFLGAYPKAALELVVDDGFADMIQSG